MYVCVSHGFYGWGGRGGDLIHSGLSHSFILPSSSSRLFYIPSKLGTEEEDRLVSLTPRRSFHPHL